MTNGRDVFFTTVMIPRKYLPKKKVDRAVYPFNILVGRRPDAMLVPHWYWVKLSVLQVFKILGDFLVQI